MIKTATARIPLVTWRDGRPRFEPGPNLRALGYAGRDLKTPEGRWFTFEEADKESIRIKAEATARKAAREEGKRLPRLTRPAMGKTLAEIATACFALPEFQGAAITTGRKTRKGLSPKTVQGYRKSASAIEKAAQRLADEASRRSRKPADSLWHAPVAAITPPLMGKLIDHIEITSGLHQARACRAFLSQLWTRLAVKEPGVIKTLFAELEKLPVPEGRIRPWTVEEFVTMVETADAMGRPEMGDSFVLGVLTVLRQGDRLQLKGLADLGSHLKVTTAKTGSEVELLKTPLLIRRLAAASIRREHHTVHWPHLIIDEQAKRPWHPDGDHYRHVFAQVRSEAAKRLASCSSITDQDLRDTAQTWLDRAGVDSRIIARLAGHNPATAAEMQARHYIEKDRRAGDEGLRAMSQLLEGKI